MPHAEALVMHESNGKVWSHLELCICVMIFYVFGANDDNERRKKKIKTGDCSFSRQINLVDVSRYNVGDFLVRKQLA